MLTSLNNPLIKQFRQLHQTKARHQENLLLLEGTNLIESACKVKYPLQVVCYTENWRDRYPHLWEIMLKNTLRSEIVSPAVLKSISTTINPDGITAIAKRRILEIPFQQQFQLGLILEKIQDPGNLGTIFRTAMATEVDGIWLSHDSVDCDHPKVLRASAGEWFNLNLAVSDNLSSIIQQYQAQGVQIISTLPKASQTYWEIDFTRPSLILIGNEGAGLTSQLSNLAEKKVQIPLARGVESLNVAIAASLLLYEAKRQRQTQY
jgi:TrmH family RNA methyltransferase